MVSVSKYLFRFRFQRIRFEFTFFIRLFFCLLIFLTPFFANSRDGESEKHVVEVDRTALFALFIQYHFEGYFPYRNNVQPETWSSPDYSDRHKSKSWLELDREETSGLVTKEVLSEWSDDEINKMRSYLYASIEIEDNIFFKPTFAEILYLSKFPGSDFIQSLHKCGRYLWTPYDYGKSRYLTEWKPYGRRSSSNHGLERLLIHLVCRDTEHKYSLQEWLLFVNKMTTPISFQIIKGQDGSPLPKNHNWKELLQEEGVVHFRFFNGANLMLEFRLNSDGSIDMLKGTNGSGEVMVGPEHKNWQVIAESFGTVMRILLYLDAEGFTLAKLHKFIQDPKQQ